MTQIGRMGRLEKERRLFTVAYKSQNGWDMSRLDAGHVKKFDGFTGPEKRRSGKETTWEKIDNTQKTGLPGCSRREVAGQIG